MSARIQGTHVMCHDMMCHAKVVHLLVMCCYDTDLHVMSRPFFSCPFVARDVFPQIMTVLSCQLESSPHMSRQGRPSQGMSAKMFWHSQRKTHSTSEPISTVNAHLCNVAQNLNQASIGTLCLGADNQKARVNCCCSQDRSWQPTDQTQTGHTMRASCVQETGFVGCIPFQVILVIRTVLPQHALA